MKIGPYTIRSARYIRRQLMKGSYRKELRPDLWYYVLGVWDSRIMGICIYRNSKAKTIEQFQKKEVSNGTK